MRLVIDMQGAQSTSRSSDIHSYSMSLAQGLVRQRGQHEVLLALNGMFHESVELVRSAFDGLLGHDEIRVWNAAGPVHFLNPDNKLRHEVAERIREAFIASLQPDIVHITSFFEGWDNESITSIGVLDAVTPVSVSLFDVINPVTHLHHDPAYDSYYLSKLAQLAQASLVLAGSESIRSSALDNCPIENHKVVTVSAEADPIFRLTGPGTSWRQLPARWGIARAFVLASGFSASGSNILTLVQAFAELPSVLRDSLQLVLVGTLGEIELAQLQTAVRAARLHDHDVVCTGEVSSAEIMQLNQTCKLFVFSDAYSVTGMPALEAMACGAATICANSAASADVIRRADALFDPEDAAAFSEVMAHVLRDDTLHGALVTHELTRAHPYSWDHKARLVWAALAAQLTAASERTSRPKINPAGKPRELLHSIVELVRHKGLGEQELAAFADAAACVRSRDALPPNRSIYVDVSMLAREDARTGIQRVTRSVLSSLLAGCASGYRVLPAYAAQDASGYRQSDVQISDSGDLRLSTGSQDPYIDPLPGDIFLGLDLAHASTVLQTATLQRMRRQGVLVYFVVYDLLPIQMPNAFPPAVDMWHTAWLRVVAQMDGALCISQSVAKDLAEWLRESGPQRMRPLKISWFHLGADLQNSHPSRGLPHGSELMLKRIKTGSSFLCVGTLEPRKGISNVLDAMDVLWHQGTNVNLVLVGKAGWNVEPLLTRIRAHPELGKRLLWLEGISDEYLEQVYSASTCLIAASHGEGFGLPLIEAAQHKLPILARDIPVFREVALEHAQYFEAATPDGLAEAINAWLTLYKLEKYPRSDSLPWKTWRESTKQLMQILQDLVSERTGKIHNHQKIFLQRGYVE